MELIEGILKKIENNFFNLEDALYDTKILVKNLKIRKNIKWIDLEINGYNNNSIIPEYRKIQGYLIGDLDKDWHIDYQIIVPSKVITKQFKIKLNSNLINNKVSDLIRFHNDIKSVNTMNIDKYKIEDIIIDDYYLKNLSNLAIKIDKSEIKHLLNHVRYKLRDLIYMIKMDNNYKEYIKSNSLLPNNKVDSKINHNINNSVVNIIQGNNNNQSLTNTITKNTLDKLRDELEKINLQDEYIKELEEIIKNNNALDKDTNEFSPKLNEWFGKLMSNGILKIGEIGTGISTNALYDVLKNFFGL